jgi:hypothetical protein
LIRRAAWAALACLVAVPAAAQDNTQAVPPPAPVTAVPLSPLGGPAAAAPQAAPVPAPAPGTPPAPPQTFTAAPEAPQAWLPRGTVDLQALDKVNARNTTLTVKVGQTATFGSLTIAVQACVVTPPDQPQDAAAFLVITDGHSGEPGFSGWMVADSPSVSMLQNPIYDIRVTGCQA